MQSIGPLKAGPPVCSSTLIVSNGYSKTLHTSPLMTPDSRSRAPSLAGEPLSHRSDVPSAFSSSDIAVSCGLFTRPACSFV
eukprot:6225912-Prymnesium_polylepis.1